MPPSPQGEGSRGGREPCGTHKCVPYNMIENYRSCRERSPLRSVVSRLWREGWYSPSVMTCGHATSPCTGEALDEGCGTSQVPSPTNGQNFEEKYKKSTDPVGNAALCVPWSPGVSTSSVTRGTGALRDAQVRPLQMGKILKKNTKSHRSCRERSPLRSAIFGAATSSVTRGTRGFAGRHRCRPLRTGKI